MLPSIDDIGRFAIFLDVDGTVVEIADRPDAVRVDAATVRLLTALSESVGGALAVISGRDIDVVDRLLQPLVLPVAGVHGLQRRDAAGRLHRAALDVTALESVEFFLEDAIGGEHGVVVERKSGAVALHYRLRPELERRCREIVESIVWRQPELQLMQGKMVYEIRLEGADKGDVIESFLAEPPFLGRTPIFAGDDVTDEAGFVAVNARGGVSVKVGAGSTLARFRAADVRDLHAWLATLAYEPRGERIV